MPALTGALLRAVVPAAILAAGLLPAGPAAAAVVFNGGPGAGAPPDSVGPYPVNPYPADHRPAGIVHDAPAPSGSLTFSRPMSLRRIADGGWSSGPWAGGTYDGAVYWNLGGGPTTITLAEPQRAFYLYGQTNYFDTYAMVATAQDGTTSGEILATTGPDGDNGAFFGFYGTGDDLVASVTISSPDADDDFAVGSFGGAVAAGGPSVEQIAGDTSVEEGATATYAVAATDASGRPLGYEWSVTAGPGSISGPADGATARVRVDDGPASIGVQVVVTDVDGQAVTRRLVVHATNVAPTVTISGGGRRAVDDPRAPHAVEYAIDDPGDDTVAAVETSCGSGGSKVLGSDEHSDTAGSLRCVFARGATTLTASVRATDSDGDSGASSTQELSVGGGGPLVTLRPSNKQVVDEGATERSYAYDVGGRPGGAVIVLETRCGARGAKVQGSDARTDRTGRFRCVFREGPARTTVSVTARDAAGHATTDAQVVTILDPPIRASGKRISGVENAAIAKRKVARFTDPTPYSRAADYRATIDWGDGSAPTAGKIAKVGSRTFAVLGTHTYRRFHRTGYEVAVTVTDADNPANTATAFSRAVIADARIRVAGLDVTTLPAFTGAVATVRDGGGPLSDLAASIAWGDGSHSAATIARAPGGTFVVNGSHTYRRSGRYDVTVRVESAGGSDDRARAGALVFELASAAGATFAIGDAHAAPGDRVTFWGPRWSRENGVAVDAAFKGFVPAQAGRAFPRCGDTWTASAPARPPADVPELLGVVVTGAVTRSGSTFAGRVRKVVVVKTSSGYRPDDARDATGKVVAVICD